MKLPQAPFLPTALVLLGLWAGSEVSLAQAGPESAGEELGLSAPSDPTDPAESGAEPESSDRPPSKSGFDIPTMGGPDGVSRELQDQDKIEAYRFTILHDALAPWFAWKARIHERHGLSLGLNATVLGQYGDGTLGERETAGGGIYRLQAAWKAVGRGGGSPGTLNLRFEYRSRIGPLGPSSLSRDLGIVAPNSGFAYSDEFGPDLAVVNWTQLFAGKRAGFVVGRLDFAAYLDPYPFQTFSRGFLNRAFILNPTAATPGVGALGAGIKGFVSDHLWLGAMAYDANAVSGEWDPDTFEIAELFKHFEIGWTPSIERRKTDKVQFTWWEKDERVAAGQIGGSGWLLSASAQFGERYLPFLRVGSSDGGGGAAAEDAVSIGVGIKNRYDELTLGMGWSRPSEKTHGPDLDDEVAFEAAYRLQMSPNSTLMPDVQLILNPASNPEKSSVWVWGLRARWET